MHEIFEANFIFTSHDEARAFFISLQNEIKNMNFMAFESEKYIDSLRNVQHKIKAASNA